MVQIYADKLAQQFRQSLSSVYCVAGDDILQRNEACEQVRSAFENAGFTEKEKHYQDNEFRWSDLLAGSQAMSLFGEKRLIELHLNSSKIGVEGSNAITTLSEELNQQEAQETALLVIAPSLNGKPKWVTTITRLGIFVPVYALEGARLQQWLIARASKYGLTLSQQNAGLLADRVEGNSIAADQELQKLALLLNNNANISEQHIDEWVADSARFSVFKMLDHAIAGQLLNSIRALMHLRDEGTALPAITPAVANRISVLLSLAEYKQHNRLEQGFQAERVFPRQKSHYQQILNRLSIEDLHRCLKLCSRADIASKSGNESTAWSMLEIVLCELGGKHPAHTHCFLPD